MHSDATVEFRPLTGSTQQDNYGKMYAMYGADDLGDIVAFDPSHFHFWRAIDKGIIMPLMKPALTTVAILQFLQDWNDFFAPFIYLNRIQLFTAAIGMRFFQYIPLETTDPRDHLLMAAAAIMTIPVLILFIAAQRYFISGVVLSGLKL